MLISPQYLSSCVAMLRTQNVSLGRTSFKGTMKGISKVHGIDAVDATASFCQSPPFSCALECDPSILSSSYSSLKLPMEQK